MIDQDIPSTNQPLKGYKVFYPGFKAKHGAIKYKENETFTVDLHIALCGNGLHFCENAADCFSYYDFNPQNIVCEVEALGEIIKGDNKHCTNILKIGRIISWEEVLRLVNTGSGNSGLRNSGDRNSGDSNSGNRNSGDRNSGDSNSGYRNSGDSNSGNRNSGDSNSGNRNSGDSNSGDRNSGDSNSGYRNSGDWNSGDRNSGDSNSGYRNAGAFCLEQDPVLWLFDRPTKMTVKEWEQSEPINVMNRLLETHFWVDSSNMSEQEKQTNPTHETTGGYLKLKTLHESWKDMWGNLAERERKLFINLENFDAGKFEQITGIKVDQLMPRPTKIPTLTKQTKSRKRKPTKKAKRVVKPRGKQTKKKK